MNIFTAQIHYYNKFYKGFLSHEVWKTLSLLISVESLSLIYRSLTKGNQISL